MISLATLHPEHFNNNADQGNIEVLARVMKRAQIAFETSETISPQSDFVLIGDASFAAIAHYEAELESLIPLLTERLQAGRPTLIVGSSYEFYLKRMGGLPEFRVSDRQSGFVSVKTILKNPVVGYRNSELFDAEVFISEGFIGTQLFGPILAKNPDLLDLVLLKLGTKLELAESDLELIAEVRKRTTF